MVWFVLNWKNLQGQGIKPFKYLTDENGKVIGETHKGDDKSGAKEPLTKLERNRVLAIILVSALSVIFWLFYYQQELALVIYMTDYINMNLGSFSRNLHRKCWQKQSEAEVKTEANEFCQSGT